MNHQAITLFVLSLLILSTVHAVPAAPSPSCKVKIVINDVKFIPAQPCPLGDGREVSQRYLAAVKIMQNLGTVNQEGEGTCEGIYPDGAHQEFTITENLVKGNIYVGTVQSSGDECNHGSYFTNYYVSEAPEPASGAGCENEYTDNRFQDELDASGQIFIKARDMCYIVQAINTKDASPCQNIQYNQQQARLKCYYKVAANTKDPSICEKTPGDNGGGILLKDFCYRDYATVFNDPAACAKIQDLPMKNECFSKIAANLNNPSICEKIEDRQMGDICKENMGIHSGKCAQEGELFSKVFRDQYPSYCCPGLTEWPSGMDTRRVENGKCIETGMLSGNPVGTCIRCGNGICDPKETLCNCPQDCSSNIPTIPQPQIPPQPPIPQPPMIPPAKCEQRCEQFRYSYCPPVCAKACVPSTCSGGTCTADCDGPGSCFCFPNNTITPPIPAPMPQQPPIPMPQQPPMPTPTQPIPAQPPIPPATMKCQGCEIQNRCLPYGTRTRAPESGTPVFCSIDGAMQPQRSNGEECQNHYECSTNTCSDSKCSSIEERIGGLEREVKEQRGLLQTILDFFKRIWG